MTLFMRLIEMLLPSFRHSVRVPVLKKLLSGVAAFLMCGIISSIMVSMVLVGGFYAIYRTLLEGGIPPEVGAMITGGSFTLLTVIFVYVTWFYGRRIHDLSHQLFDTEIPFFSHINRITSSFIDGLMQPTPQGEKENAQEQDAGQRFENEGQAKG